jgi:hypothetical protein
MDNHVVVAFGRMNPPTIGHQKLVDVVKAEAHRVGGRAEVHLSKSHDPKKNPLPYEDKIKHAQVAFGDVVKDSEARNPLDVLKSLHGKAKQVTVVAGSDRVEGFKQLFDRYNGDPEHYTFHRIRVISAGDRDPDSDGAEGMSASKMREHAKNNDIGNFRSGLPDNIKHHADSMMGKIREHMKLKESTLISMFKRLFLEKEHDKCGTPECCGQCETADSPTAREWGKITLVNKYKEDTPGETPMKRFKNFKEDLDAAVKIIESLDKHIADFAKGIKSSESKSSLNKNTGKPVANMKHVETDAKPDEVFGHLQKMGFKKRKGYDPNPNSFTTSHNADTMTTKSSSVHHPSGVSAHFEKEHGSKMKVHFYKEELGEEKDGLKGSCWKNYVAIGTKKKNGKTVPNCVPKK